VCIEAASLPTNRKLAKGSHPKDHSKRKEEVGLASPPIFPRKPEHPKRKDGAGVRVHIEAASLPGIQRADLLEPFLQKPKRPIRKHMLGVKALNNGAPAKLPKSKQDGRTSSTNSIMILRPNARQRTQRSLRRQRQLNQPSTGDAQGVRVYPTDGHPVWAK
jgi:hypothetical protein